jgi:hypothetical protein
MIVDIPAAIVEGRDVRVDPPIDAADLPKKRRVPGTLRKRRTEALR